MTGAMEPRAASNHWERAPRLARYAVAAVAMILLAVHAIGGYFESHPFSFVPAPPGAPRHRDPVVAVFWSGDMGLRLGTAETVIGTLGKLGFPVLTVSSPMLFAGKRDTAFVDEQVARSLREALDRSGASKVVVIGNSFGADMVAVGLGHLPADLRARISSVVLVVPGMSIHFHANPTGLFYTGPTDADPDRTIRLLHGLPVSCIYGRAEDDSLCDDPLLTRARRIGIDDGHMMLWSREAIDRAVINTVLSPPRPLV